MGLDFTTDSRGIVDGNQSGSLRFYLSRTEAVQWKVPIFRRAKLSEQSKVVMNKR
jgi:hypothetical protein